MTEFQQLVYNALKKIPKGRVTTYKKLGIFIGCKSPRAIGQALRCNPFSPKVPCHRVIKSDGTIGGFAGAIDGEKLQRKMSLLKKEGVLFCANRLVDDTLLFDPNDK